MSIENKKALLSCPGDLIIEILETIGMSQAELAERLGRSSKFVNELIKGKAHITSQIAHALEMVIGYTAKGWLALDRAYQDEIMEIQKMEYAAQCVGWVKKFPLSFMNKNGYITDIRDKEKVVSDLLSFFRVRSPNEHYNIYNEASIAFKIELKHTKDPEAISVWLRIGEIDADKIELNQFDKRKLNQSIPIFKRISYSMDNGWHNELRSILADCGVAISYTPMIKKAPIYGAARWIKSKSVPLIQITDRGKDANKFWFSFYHELGHILLHGKKDIFIEGDSTTLHKLKMDVAKENEADIFAEKILFSNTQIRRLENIIKGSVTGSQILELSRSMKVNKSFIVSKLQRMGILEYNQLNNMKVKVDFAKIID